MKNVVALIRINIIMSVTEYINPLEDHPGCQAHIQDAINIVREVVLSNILREPSVDGFTEYKKEIDGQLETFHTHPCYHFVTQEQRDVWYN